MPKLLLHENREVRCHILITFFANTELYSGLGYFPSLAFVPFQIPIPVPEDSRSSDRLQGSLPRILAFASRPPS